jgi:hypothetical protein
MDPNNGNDVIATRRLMLLDDPSHEIVVLMGRPMKTIGVEEYSCSVQITGLGDQRLSRIYGVDSFQAIQLTLRFIGSRLSALNAEAGGRLRWEGDEGGGFGFSSVE